MPEPVSKFFRSFGVTPAQLVLGCVLVGSWWSALKPLPDKFDELNKSVSNLSTKVEIHSILIAQISSVQTEVKATKEEVGQMRRELSSVEGRLASHPILNLKNP